MDKKEKALEYLRNLEKLKASGVKSADYTSDLDKDVVHVKGGPAPVEKPTRIKNMTQKIDTRGATDLISGEDFTKKIEALRALKGAGKKVAGIIPMAGVAMAALQGDPAMAAEELAEDAAGPLAALKPDTAGDREAERDLMTEIQARKNYKKSAAYRDARGMTEEEQDIEEMSKPKPKAFSKLRKFFGE